MTSLKKALRIYKSFSDQLRELGKENDAIFKNQVRNSQCLLEWFVTDSLAPKSERQKCKTQYRALDWKSRCRRFKPAPDHFYST